MNRLVIAIVKRYIEHNGMNKFLKIIGQFYLAEIQLMIENACEIETSQGKDTITIVYKFR